MNVRRMILFAAGAVLASGAGAQRSTQDTTREPPRSEDSSTAEKARELGRESGEEVKKGAETTRRKVNEGGQRATAAIVGTKTVTGKIADVSADQVTVNKDDGTPLNLRVTDGTKVTIGGKDASRGSLQQGAQVRASYAQSGGEATATKIEVTRTPKAKESKSEARSKESK